MITGYVNITPFDAVAVKTALVNEGPISIAIDAVLLVGFGTIFDQPYWLIKNRYSKNW